MIKKIFFAVLLILPIAVFAQNGGKNQVVLFGTGAWYFNKGGLHQDGVSPDPMTIRNSGGYSFGTAYQRAIGGRYLIGLSIEYGAETLECNVYRDLSNYDLVNAPQKLDGYTFNYNLDRTSHFFYPKLLFGIQQPITNDSKVQLIAGIGEKLTRRQNPSIHLFDVYYPYDNGVESGADEFGFCNTNIRGDKLSLNPFEYKAPMLSTSLELRLVRIVEARRRVGFFAGVIVERGIGTEVDHGPRYVKVFSKNDLNDKVGSNDWYSSRNFSIGIKFGIGLF